MKICILNMSGNVGKSTLAIHLLAAFNSHAKIVSVESVNASNADDVKGVEVETLGAGRFKDIYREVMLHDDVIVDVGASNVVAFMNEITRFKSSVGEFDMVIVPTVPADKQQKDTNSTIDWLSKLGIEGKRVRVVFNQYDSGTLEPLEMVYPQVFGYLMTEGKGKAVYEPHAVVAHNEVFELIKPTGRTIKQVAEDTTDWRAKRKEASKAADVDAVEHAMDQQIMKDLALTAQHNLEHVNGLLFGAPKAASGKK